MMGPRAKSRDTSKERLKKRAAEHIVGGMMGEGESVALATKSEGFFQLFLKPPHALQVWVWTSTAENRSHVLYNICFTYTTKMFA